MNNIKTHIIDKERWLEVAENIAELGNMCAASLRRENYEGQGEQDAKELEADIFLATLAVRYVAEFARDKCVFGVVNSGRK